MSQDFQAGDFLLFQIESGYGLIRILHIEGDGNETVWHVSAFEDMFLDIESADSALASTDSLTTRIPHVALTNRAFHATQVARMKNEPLDEPLVRDLEQRLSERSFEISDRSIRLMLGLR